MKNVNTKLLAAVILLATCTGSANAQKKKSKVAEKDTVITTVARGASNMMLNAL